MPDKESKIESYFTQQCEKAGAEVRKLAWVGRRHAPDRIAFFPYGIVWFVELKRPGKKPRAGQGRELERLKNKGCRTTWLSTYDDIDNWLLGVLDEVRSKSAAITDHPAHI